MNYFITKQRNDTYKMLNFYVNNIELDNYTTKTI